MACIVGSASGCRVGGHGISLGGEELVFEHLVH